MNIPDAVLIARLRRYNLLYVSGTPAVTDAEFDRLYDRALKLFPDHSFFQQVGSTYGVEVDLPITMGSLTKVRPDDAFAWASKVAPKGKNAKIPMLVTPKLDGAAIVLCYRKNKFVQAITRGDGKRGIDVTEAFRFVNFPTDIYPMSSEFYVRVELCLSRSAFRKLAKHKDFEYVNPRNAIVGCLNAKNKESIHKRALQLATPIALGIDFPDQFFTKSDQLDMLDSAGFSTAVQFLKNKRYGHAAIIPESEKIWPKSMRETITNLRNQFPFDTDGIVIEFNHVGAELMGTDANGLNPAWARAVKLDPSEQDAKNVEVHSINWQRTPRGIVKPVVVLKYDALFQGVRVRNVFVDNARYVKANKIGPGSVVSVIRSGDVIPRIIAITKPADEKISLPKLCNKHGEKLVWTDTKVDLYCPTCAGELNSPADFFKQLNPDNVGKTLVDHVCASLGLETVRSVLEAHPSSLTSIEKFSSKRASQFKAAIIKAVADASLAKIMHASGAFRSEKLGLGEARLQLIIDQVGIDRLMSKKMPTPRDLEHMARRAEGIGDQVAKCFGDQFVHFYEFFDTIREFAKTADAEASGKSVNKGVLTGLKFCFTGFRNNEAEMLIKRNGGVIANSVSKGVNVLFASSSATVKADKATKLGIPVVEQRNVIEFLEKTIKKKLKKAGMTPEQATFQSGKPKKDIFRNK